MSIWHITGGSPLRGQIRVQGSKNAVLPVIAASLLCGAETELLNCPTIPVNVTMNEYIELSKSYSSDKSPAFINGVLDNIVKDLTANNKLTKVKIVSNK